MIDVEGIRKDFPILKRKIHGKPLVYLDNAATTQKPRQVIDALVDFYERHNANVHRGSHTLTDEATTMYEDARKTVANFVGASDPKEIVFVRNTTEAINLVAYSWGRTHIGKGDEILISELEHHSNIVPWQMLAKEKGATVKYLRVDSEGKLDSTTLRDQLTNKTKLVALSNVSNFLGTINPIEKIAEVVKKQRKVNGLYPLLLVDGAQAVPHMSVDIASLGCDFYAFSGHKMYGPMGVGGLWVRRDILESMSPFLTGGGMILKVTMEGSSFADLPDRFDAGTPDVADAVGLAAAVKYLGRIGMEKVRKHELELTEYALKKLKVIDHKLKVKIFGPERAEERGGLVAFTVYLNGQEVHGHDVAQILDSEGVEVRSGHHCTMPMHIKLGLAATTRASFGVYNTKDDVDRFIDALAKVEHVFR